MAGEAVFSWSDCEIKLRNTFLHVVQPPQGSRPQRASSAPASLRRSESQGVPVGSAAHAGASGMMSQDYEEDAHVGVIYESPIVSEADVASVSSGLDDSSSASRSAAERPFAAFPLGTASTRGPTEVKLLELIEVHAVTPRSASTGWAGDSDQSNSMRGEASCGTESKFAGDWLLADVDCAGPINSTKDFEALRSVPRCNLSPSRFPAAGVPIGAAAPGAASNHVGNMFLNTGYFGSRTDVAMKDPARSRVMTPLRPVTSCDTSGRLSPSLGAAPVSGQTQPYSGNSANTQDDFTAERFSSGWSLGTALHSIGKCRPCSFVWKEGGCTQGTSCKFCHAWRAAKKTSRPCKSKRAGYRKLLEKMAATVDGGAHAQADPRWA